MLKNLVLIDLGVDFGALGIVVGNTIRNTTDGSLGRIDSVSIHYHNRMIILC